MIEADRKNRDLTLIRRPARSERCARGQGLPSFPQDPTLALADGQLRQYALGMKTNTKSSITLPAAELKLVVALQAKLKAKSKVEVVRRGLRLLQETTDRASLRDAYRSASRATRASLGHELAELDHLASEGLDEL